MVETLTMIVGAEAARRILDGATQYRYLMRPQPEKGEYISYYVHDDGEFYICDYEAGNVVGIREPWRLDENGNVVFMADGDEGKFKPPFTLNRKAIRIWVRVLGVYAERLQNIKVDDLAREGFDDLEEFKQAWSERLKSQVKTIRNYGITKYKWEDNPWVWVVEFEEADKPQF